MDNFPLEMLHEIFLYMSRKEVLACRRVCCWWEAAVDVFIPVDAWEEFCKQDYADWYQSSALKSSASMSWLQIYENLALRSEILQSDVYKCVGFVGESQEAVKKLYVFKDILILVMNQAVKFFNIDHLCNMSLMFEKPGPYHDYAMSDYIILSTPESEAGDMNTILYGKSTPSSIHEEDGNDLKVDHVEQYKFVDDRCYVLNNQRKVWLYCWENSKWISVFLAKNYEVTPLGHMIVYNHEVYFIQWYIYTVLQEEKRLERVENPPINMLRMLISEKCDFCVQNNNRGNPGEWCDDYMCKILRKVGVCRTDIGSTHGICARAVDFADMLIIPHGEEVVLLRLLNHENGGWLRYRVPTARGDELHDIHRDTKHNRIALSIDVHETHLQHSILVNMGCCVQAISFRHH